MKKLKPKKKTGPGNIAIAHHIVQSFKAIKDAERTPFERTADWMTQTFGSFWFLLFNIFWFMIWMAINIGLIDAIPPFDPFPFNLLTMTVSLEAIMLAIFVLISQNRSSKIEDVREETDLQIDVITEQEVTKILELLVVLLKKNDIDVSKDKTLREMLKPVNEKTIENVLEREF